MMSKPPSGQQSLRTMIKTSRWFASSWISSSVITRSPKKTALVLAITEKKPLIQLLIHAYVEVNALAVGGVHRTALQAAVETGNLEITLLLLQAGAEANAAPATYGGVAALQAAAIGGYAGALLNRGAVVNSALAPIMGGQH
jgi:ankyrin repeat protein